MMNFNLNKKLDTYILTPTDLGKEKGLEKIEVNGIAAANFAMNLNEDCYTMEKKL